MSITFEKREATVLSEVLKEYLTDLRTEILDAEDPSARSALEEKERTLLEILAELEKKKRSGVRPKLH
jgi:hypothetical protein